MRKHIPAIVITAALVAAIAGISVLYAQDQQGSSGRGMMGQMSQMMGGCAGMMQSRGNDGGRPNDRWRKPAPSNPDKSG